MSLAETKGKWVVLYFYPKDFTSGCTVEAHNFQRDIAKYEKANAVILGVSLDTVDSHKGFCTKEGLSFKLLADTEGAVTKAYGSVATLQREDLLRAKHVPDRPVGRDPEGLREGEPDDAQRRRPGGPRRAPSREVAMSQRSRERPRIRMKRATPAPQAPFRRSAPTMRSGFQPPPTGWPLSGKTTKNATSVGRIAPRTTARSQ